MLNELIEEFHNHLTDSNRPFTGQAHTDQGERGKTEIKGIRFRDLADCVIKAMVDSLMFTITNEKERDMWERRLEDGTLNYNDVYELDFNQIDPIALVQNISCRVEMAMGIYPNL